MTLSISAEPLRKILELEHKKDYIDSAVIGGLDKFLRNWAVQAIESITSPQQLTRFHELHLTNPNYASLTKQQRKQWVSKVLDFLAEAEAG
ncbi:MAG TPA: DNA helicase RecG, partial [Dehalococcoidia bacterium]|nr:DNA helicase RecG [Dehalococcoidia bacterium]